MQDSAQATDSVNATDSPTTVDGLDHIFGGTVSAVMSVTGKAKKVELPIAEAAKALGMSERTLWRRIEDGDFKSRLKGNKRLVKVPLEQLPGPDASASTTDKLGSVGTLFNLKDVLDQLASANFRVGYLQGQLSEKEQQLRLLPDLTEKADEANQLRARLAAAEAELSFLKQPWWKRLFPSG